MIFKICISIFTLIFCSSIQAIGQPLRVESKFQPPSITIAGQSTYKIIIHGSQQSPEGALPQVDGLLISKSPQSFRSASFINGVPSVRVELSFQVNPQKTGNHTIPSWTMRVGSESVQVPASTLNVLPPNQQDIIRKKEEEKQKQDLKQASFIEFKNPRPYLFEGETVSAQIELFIWDRLPVSRIERAPQKSGDAFSITELGQPQEKRNISKFNKVYTIFSWPVGLTAAIAGKHLITFNTSIRVRVKSRGNSPFNSPFFNDPFFGFGREESLSVSSDSNSIEVRELPMDERPESFRGAIGSFTTSSKTDTDRVSLGDPVRLVFEIEGTGNFSAMPAPILESNNEFKIGPPAFSFVGNEITKHEGKQSFEYILSPLKAGLLNVPAISFSFFDPIQEKYFSADTKTHKLRIDPGEAWIDPTLETIATVDSDEKKFATDLFQTESVPGEWKKSIGNETLFESKIFWVIQIVPLVCSLSLLFYGWKRKQTGKDLFRKKQTLLKKQMKDAVSYNDPVLFYRSSRERLRLEIGTLYQHPNPASLSSNELIHLLENERNNNELILEVKNILQWIDSYEFAATENDSLSLGELLSKINQLIKKIK